MSNRHESWYFGNQHPDAKITIHYCAVMPVQFWTYPSTLFRYWCYYWNFTPGAQLYFENRRIELNSDIAVLIPPFTAFATDMRSSFRQFYIHFSVKNLFDHIRREPIVLPGGRAAAMVPELMKKPEEQSMLQLRGLLSSELAAIPQEMFLNADTYALDPRLRRAVDFMHDNLAHLPDNRHICRKAGLGINEFYVLFKRELHKSPRQFIIMLRMEYASSRLRHTDETIDQIADGCGYADRYSFSKEFRRCYRLPPAEFRRLHQG